MIPALILVAGFYLVGTSAAEVETACIKAAKNTTWDPVCASNGKTFHNPLALDCYAEAVIGHRLSKKQGTCEDEPSPDHCALAYTVWRQVCGTDNKTYSSVFELLCEAAERRNGVDLMYEGACRIPCKVSLYYEPVCSIDIIDYPNIESLECYAARNTHLNMSVLRYTDCKGKTNNPCGVAEPSGCNKENQVCATNGVTYKSQSIVACLKKNNPELNIIHDGPCTLFDIRTSSDPNEVCFYAQTHDIMLPVCGTDNVTYPNPFVLECSALTIPEKDDLRVARVGKCEDPPVKEEDDDDDDSECYGFGLDEEEELIICGSDGKTYRTAKEYACAVKENGDWYRYFIKRLGRPCELMDDPCEMLKLGSENFVSEPICGTDRMTYANPTALMCAMKDDSFVGKLHKGHCLT